MAGDEENDEPLLSLEEVLCYAGKADGAVEHTHPIDCDNPPTPGTAQGGDKRRETDGHSRVQSSGGGSTSMEQGGQQGSPNIPATSVLEVRCDPWDLLVIIPTLIDSADIDALSSTRIDKVPSPILPPLLILPLLHLLHQHQHNQLAPSPPRCPVHK